MDAAGLCLRQSGTVLALLNASLDSAFLFDREGVILAVNETGARKMGNLSARDMTGRTMADFVPADVFERRMQAVREVFDTGTQLRFEDSRDGLQFDNNLVPVFGDDGRVQQVAVFAHDVTGSRAVEETLRRRAFQQGVVAELGVFALSSLDSAELLGKTCRLLSTLFSAQFTEVLRLADDQSHLLMVAGTGWPAGMAGAARLELSGTQAGLALVTGKPVVVEHLESDGRFQHKSVPLGAGVASGLSAVIHGQERPYGVLGVHSSRPRAYATDEVHTLQAVANVLSAALERIRTLDALHRLSERNQTVLNSVAHGIYGVDRQGRVTFANPAATRLTGFSREELLGRKAHSLLHHTRPDGVLYPEEDCPLSRTLADGRHRQVEEDVYWRKDGTSFPVDFTCTALSNDGRLEGAVVVFEDITARRQAEERLRRQAFRDELTGLPNRAAFAGRLAQELEVGRSFAVLLLDLDDFKVVNDGLGHDLGDRLLRSVARRIGKAVGEGVFLARLGGDEFAALLAGVPGREAALAVADAVHAEFSTPEMLEGYEVFVSASVGVVLDGGRYDGADEVLRDADTAMFKAKALGKGESAVFDRAMHQEVRSKLLLESDLRRALERGEFFLVYQPIVDLRAMVPAGFEALIRWRHPERGLVPPLDFIPAAEASGLILPIGSFVLAEACAQLAQWRELFPCAQGLTMSVNLSGRQFMQHDLAGSVARIIEASGLPAPAVKLEITESVIMEHAGRTVEMLGELKATGVSLMIDDFGTGYSSLAYLRRFPVDALKVDRAFVRNVDTDQDNLRIVRAVVQLADSMDMCVVAEGIETAAELRELTGLGCAYGQGYHFAKPLTAAEALTYLRQFQG